MKNIILFETKKVRTHWDEANESWCFSIIDVIEILTESPRPRKYWNALKTKLQSEGSELSQIGTVENESRRRKNEEYGCCKYRAAFSPNSIYSLPKSRTI